ncbi:putative ribonuclease H-like domain-containing protein, partial [Tanacetum coccineum]
WESFTNADDLPTDPLMPDLEDIDDLLNIGIFSGAYDDEDVGAEADLNNLETTMNVSPIPTTRIHKDHPKDQIIRDINSATQTRRMTKISEEHAMKVTQALTDPSWIEAMQDELLQFRLQKVWRLVDLPKGKHAIGTKWVYRNKKDERGIVVRNKARLVAQGYTQEEGIDYDEVFTTVARIEEIRLFLAYASYMGFIVCQIDVKSTFLYGIIEEEVYVCQPHGFKDLQFPTKTINRKFRIGIIDKTLFIKKDKGDILLVQRDDEIFISQDKYVADILKKFDSATMKTASTPLENNKALIKDEEAEDVDVHLYRSMIGSLMYLTTSRPDIIFTVCACARPSKRMKRFLRRPPYADDASPTAQSPNYVPESGPEADPEEDDNEDPEEDPADGGDDAMTYLLHHYHSPPPLHVVITNTPPSPIRSLAIDFLFSSPPLLLPSASRREDRPEVKSYLTSKRLGRSAEPERAVGYGITTRVMRKLRTLRGNPLVSDTDWTDEQNAYTHHPYGGKAGSRLVPKLWRRTMDRVICPGEVMSAVHSILIIFKIRELHDADRRREAVTSEMLKADHRRSAEMRYPTGTCGSITGTGHSTIEGDNKGPAGGPAQLDAARGGCHDAAYAMTWANLRKKMTDKYCLRNEMKKLEAKLWNLKVKIPSCVMKRERKAKNNLLMAIVPRSIWKIHGMMRQKRSGNQIRTSKSSTNKVKSSFTGAYSTCTPSTSSTNISEKEILADFADEVIYSLFAKQSEDWDLLHEDMNKLREMNLDI